MDNSELGAQFPLLPRRPGNGSFLWPNARPLRPERVGLKRPLSAFPNRAMKRGAPRIERSSKISQRNRPDSSFPEIMVHDDLYGGDIDPIDPSEQNSIPEIDLEPRPDSDFPEVMVHSDLYGGGDDSYCPECGADAPRTKSKIDLETVPDPTFPEEMVTEGPPIPEEWPPRRQSVDQSQGILPPPIFGSVIPYVDPPLFFWPFGTGRPVVPIPELDQVYDYDKALRLKPAGKYVNIKGPFNSYVEPFIVPAHSYVDPPIFPEKQRGVTINVKVYFSKNLIIRKNLIKTEFSYRNKQGKVIKPGIVLKKPFGITEGVIDKKKEPSQARLFRPLLVETFKSMVLTNLQQAGNYWTKELNERKPRVWIRFKFSDGGFTEEKDIREVMSEPIPNSKRDKGVYSYEKLSKKYKGVNKYNRTLVIVKEIGKIKIGGGKTVDATAGAINLIPPYSGFYELNRLVCCGGKGNVRKNRKYTIHEVGHLMSIPDNRGEVMSYGKGTAEPPSDKVTDRHSKIVAGNYPKSVKED